MKHATFNIQHGRAVVTWPTGRTQNAHADPGARSDECGFLYVDDHGYMCLGTMSHEEARRKRLTADEWSYEAKPGEIAGTLAA